MKLGVRLESLGLPFRQALAAASIFGVGGVQFDAVGDLSPERLGATARKEVRHLLKSHQLELTAVQCPMRHGLDYPVNLQPRIERLIDALTLSFDLGARRVIIEAGRIPAEKGPNLSNTMPEALRALAAHGDRIGAILALETGQESGEVLAQFLGQLGVSGLGVNYDPANLMIHGFDAVAGLTPLRPWIVHTHGHDFRRSGASRGSMEVPIGHGDIEWISYIATLAAQEYTGWVVVETEQPDRTVVEQGVRFLRKLI